MEHLQRSIDFNTRVITWIQSVKAFPATIQYDELNSHTVNDAEDLAAMLKHYEAQRDTPDIIVRWRGGKSEPVCPADALVIAKARHAEGYRVQFEYLD